MFRLSTLPTLNCLLNLLAAILIVSGFVLVRSGRKRAHAAAMLGATATSALFLVSYVTYHTVSHYTRGSAHTPYTGVGLSRGLYFAVLSTHVVLAAAVVPLVLRTLYLALRRRWDVHRRWGRWTLPIWLYVSVTGIVVYLMLYGLDGPPA